MLGDELGLRPCAQGLLRRCRLRQQRVPSTRVAPRVLQRTARIEFGAGVRQSVFHWKRDVRLAITDTRNGGNHGPGHDLAQKYYSSATLPAVQATDVESQVHLAEPLMQRNPPPSDSGLQKTEANQAQVRPAIPCVELGSSWNVRLQETRLYEKIQNEQITPFRCQKRSHL